MQRTGLNRFGVVGAGLAALLATAPAPAEIRVDIDGVSGAERANVMAYLSLQRYRTQQDLDEATLLRLEARAVDEVGEALQPFGYYEPTVRTELRREGADWVARVTIRLGEPTVIAEASVSVTGPGSEDSSLTQIMAENRIVQGARVNHQTYDRLKNELLRRAISRGYLDAHYERSELLVDRDRHEARAYLALLTGERYRFGRITVDQDRLNEGLMRRYLRIHEGEWFDSGQLLRTQFALDDSAYFGSVEVLPGERDTKALTIPVVITARGAKRNKYTVGVGYSTDQLWRVTGTWDNRLLNDAGHRFRADMAVGTKAQSYGVTYTIPVGDPALEKLEFGATQLYESPGDVHSITSLLHAGLTQVRGQWQYVPFVDFAHTESQIAGSNSTQNLLVPGITIAQVPRGFMSNSGSQSSIIGSTPGSTSVGGSTSVAAGDSTGLFAEILGTGESLHSDVRFLRWRIRDTFQYGLAPKWRLVLRGEVGMTFVQDFAQMPINYRFFTGGDQSVRGYAYESLSPTDSLGQKSGGKDLLVASTEVDRDIRPNVAVAVFVDGGNALMRFGDPLAYGAGVGIRYRLPFLSLGIDVAKPLSNGGGSPRLHLNIAPVF